MVVDDEECDFSYVEQLSNTQAAAGQSLHCTLLEAVLKGWGRVCCRGRGEREGWKKNIED